MRNFPFTSRIAGLLLALTLTGTARSTPYIPTDDGTVIETLPAAASPALRALAVQRRSLLHAPASAQRDAGAVLPLVRGFIEAARHSGDPRYLGQAQQLLQPWAGSGDPAHPVPADIRVLRATIAQSLHQFDAALAELDDVLRASPLQVQALLTRATVLQVRGRFVEAQADCRRLAEAGAGVPAQLCLASVAGLTGQDAAASRLLAALMPTLPDNEASLRSWLLTLQAEQAERRGELRAADTVYRQALATDPQDRYVRAAWCDLLLEQRDSNGVLALTQGREADDALLLRQALALAQRGDGSEATALAQLRERFRLQRQRGDASHLREEAQMALTLEHDAPRALRLAQQNWLQQREPADARVLYRAARAVDDPQALRTLRDWVLQTGLHDRELRFGAAT